MDQGMHLSIGLMTVNVALSALAQIFLKPGMTANDVQASLRNESISSTIYYVMTSPQVISGLGCFGLSLILAAGSLESATVYGISFHRGLE
ncbi:MAG: hypothetical protein QOE55_6394 [Acidobacteriaceae bacterium]|jgi:hypothetical protein|nr:hypothetical protein [Acidobacteriaceae bacterium]